jgi:hypothetical protein
MKAMQSITMNERWAGDIGAQFQFHDWLFTAVAGHRFQATAAVPGEPVQLVREPDNPADGKAIAVLDMAGRRVGYLFRELAAEYAALMDHGIVRLSGRLVAPGEPGYDAERAAINPPLIVVVDVNPVRLDALVGRGA